MRYAVDVAVRKLLMAGARDFCRQVAAASMPSVNNAMLLKYEPVENRSATRR